MSKVYENELYWQEQCQNDYMYKGEEQYDLAQELPKDVDDLLSMFEQFLDTQS